MSATVRITRAAVPPLSAMSVAVASSAIVSPVVAVGDTVKLNAVTMDFGAPATGRVSDADAAPVAANVTCFRPPASLAFSVTVTACPALTLSPEALPEIETPGATASSTVNDTGTAGVVWPLLSTARRLDLDRRTRDGVVRHVERERRGAARRRGRHLDACRHPGACRSARGTPAR